jgi:hypothetical protein
MPIVVKHEADMGAAAGLAALANALSKAKLPSMPTGGRGRGGGGGRATSGYRPGIPSYEDTPHQLEKLRGQQRMQELMLRADLAQQAEQREVEREREEQAWIWEFTPQQQFEMAKNRNRLQELELAHQHGEITFSDYSQGKQKLENEYNSYQKTKRPRTSSDPGPYQEGREPGKIWKGEDGNTYITEQGTGNPKLLASFDKTPDGIALKAKLDAEKAEVERMKTLEDDYGSEVRELYKLKKKDALGNELFLSPDEIEERSQRILKTYPELYQRKLQEELVTQVAERDAALNQEVIEREKRQAEIERVPGGEDLPGAVREARALIHILKDKYKKGFKTMPDEVKDEFLRAAAIVDEYDRMRGAPGSAR